jgi:hypothetical protein
MTWEEYQKKLNEVHFTAKEEGKTRITIYDDEGYPVMEFNLPGDTYGADMLSNVKHTDIRVMAIVFSATRELMNTPYDRIHITPVYKLVWQDGKVMGYNVKQHIWNISKETNLQHNGYQTIFSDEALAKIAGRDSDLLDKMNAIKERV